MEKKLTLEVDTANSKIVAETQEEMKAIEQYMSDIQDISHKFDFIFPHVTCSSAMHDLQHISS
jgi:hypothetical protein